MPRKLGAVNIFEAAWLNRFLGDAREFRRLRKVEENFSEMIVAELNDGLADEDRQQAIFSLLGEGFVLKNFPHHKYDPDHMTSLKTHRRIELIDESRRMLDRVVKALLEKYREDPGMDKKLLGDIRTIFVEDLKDEITKKLVKEKKVRVKKSKKKRGLDKVIELQGDTTPDRAAFLQVTLLDMLKTGNDVEVVITEELGKRVIILAPGFRHNLFTRNFLGDSADRNLKAQFEDQLKVQLKERGISHLSDFAGKKDIDTAVIIAYERSEALKTDLERDDDNESEKDFGEDEKLVQFARILAMTKLFRSHDNFSTTHIFWLVRVKRYFPVENPALRNGHTEDESRALHMGVCFTRFSQVIYGTKEIFALAQDVFDTLWQEERELLVKIQRPLMSGTTAVDPTLFSPDIIVLNDEKKNAFWKRFLKKKRISKDDEETFADLKLFFRKWLSEAFVETLSPNGTSLVWDYLFLNSFGKAAAINVCVALFHLLKPYLNNTETFIQVMSVMTATPKLFYTLDLRRVLKHLATGGAYETIPPPPDVPNIEVTTPSANIRKSSRKEEMESRDRRIEALSDLVKS